MVVRPTIDRRPPATTPVQDGEVPPASESDVAPTGVKAMVRRWWPPPRWALQAAAAMLAARVLQWAVLLFLRPMMPALNGQPIRSLLVPQLWDALWYERAAQHGWPTHMTVIHGVTQLNTFPFFPAFPMLIRAVHLVLPLSWTAAAGVASIVSEVAMIVAFRALARDIWDEDVAQRATLLFCFAPGAFTFALPYSEPTFLTFVILAILALRRRQWLAAGVLGALATTARPESVALMVCAAWAAMWAIWKHREWRALIAPAITPVGVVAWFAYLWAHTGIPLAWFQEERNGWGDRLNPLAFVRLVEDAHSTTSSIALPDLWAPIAGTVLAAALVAVMIWVRPPSILVVFSGIVLALSFFSQPLGLRPRFVLIAFPLVMTLAVKVKREVYSVVLAASAVTSTALLVMATYSMSPSGPVLIP